MNEENTCQPWAQVIIDKHRTAMMRELTQEYVRQFVVAPFLQKIEQDLAKIAECPAARPTVTAEGSKTVQ